jgi:hypothetical protein
LVDIDIVMWGELSITSDQDHSNWSISLLNRAWDLAGKLKY